MLMQIEEQIFLFLGLLVCLSWLDILVEAE